MSEVNVEELWAVLEEVEFVCSACSDSMQPQTTMMPLKNKTHTQKGEVYGNGRVEQMP